MSPSSPGALGLSALLHAAVLGLVLILSYAATSLVKENPKVFELVAGAGDNFAATEAPALGNLGTIKVKTTVTPEPAAPTPAPKAETTPIQAAPEAAPKEAKPVDLVKSLERAEARRERKLEAQYKKQQEEERKREEAEAKRRTRIDAEGIKEGVLGGSTANKTGGAGGKALTAEEGHELDKYFSLLKMRIKENHIPPDGVSNSLQARVKFMVAADGTISHVRIIESSGNADFDRSVVEACSHTRSIGARPDRNGDEVEMTFKMREDES